MQPWIRLTLTLIMCAIPFAARDVLAQTGDSSRILRLTGPTATDTDDEPDWSDRARSLGEAVEAPSAGVALQQDSALPRPDGEEAATAYRKPTDDGPAKPPPVRVLGTGVFGITALKVVSADSILVQEADSGEPRMMKPGDMVLVSGGERQDVYTFLGTKGRRVRFLHEETTHELTANGVEYFDAEPVELRVAPYGSIAPNATVDREQPE